MSGPAKSKLFVIALVSSLISFSNIAAADEPAQDTVIVDSQSEELVIPPVVIEIPEVEIQFDLDIGTVPLIESRPNAEFIAKEKLFIDRASSSSNFVM